MPLITSPIDGSPMKQIHRFGVELDVCPTSGGVWLDKGELEKIMTLMKEATRENDRRPEWRDRDHRYNEMHYKDKRKRPKSAMSKVMDIFDF